MQESTAAPYKVRNLAEEPLSCAWQGHQGRRAGVRGMLDAEGGPVLEVVCVPLNSNESPANLRLPRQGDTQCLQKQGRGPPYAW